MKKFISVVLAIGIVANIGVSALAGNYLPVQPQSLAPMPAVDSTSSSTLEITNSNILEAGAITPASISVPAVVGTQPYTDAQLEQMIKEKKIDLVKAKELKDQLKRYILARFTDIYPTAWYIDNLAMLYGMGVISGYPDNTFQPEKYLTRLEFQKMLAVVCNLDIDLKMPAVGTPYDWRDEQLKLAFVHEAEGGTNWGWKYVFALNKYYVSLGKELPAVLGNFLDGIERNICDNVLDRGQATEYLVKLMSDSNFTVDYANFGRQYQDNTMLPDKFKEFIYKATSVGLVTGKGLRFEPSAQLTRAEASTIIMRFLDKDSRVKVDKNNIVIKDVLPDDYFPEPVFKCVDDDGFYFMCVSNIADYDSKGFSYLVTCTSDPALNTEVFYYKSVLGGVFKRTRDGWLEMKDYERANPRALRYGRLFQVGCVFQFLDKDNEVLFNPRVGNFTYLVEIKNKQGTVKQYYVDGNVTDSRHFRFN